MHDFDAVWSLRDVLFLADLDVLVACWEAWSPPEDWAIARQRRREPRARLGR